MLHLKIFSKNNKIILTVMIISRYMNLHFKSKLGLFLLIVILSPENKS